MDLGLRWWVWEFGMPHLLVPVHRISLFYLRVSESNLTDTNSCMILEGMCDCKNDDAQTSEQDIIYIHTLHLSLILWNRKFQFSSCRYQPALRSPRRWSWSHVPVSVWFIYDILYIYAYLYFFKISSRGFLWTWTKRSLPLPPCFSIQSLFCANWGVIAALEAQMESFRLVEALKHLSLCHFMSLRLSFLHTFGCARPPDENVVMASGARTMVPLPPPGWHTRILQ